MITAQGTARQTAFDDLMQQAVNKAVAAGAIRSSVEVIDIDDVPLAYLPGEASRVRIKAVGDLNLTGGSHA